MKIMNLGRNMVKMRLHEHPECNLHAIDFRQRALAFLPARVASSDLSRFLHHSGHSPPGVAFL